MDRKVILPIPGNTPVTEHAGLFGIQKLFLKDETKNPTFTFKDRLAYEMVRPIAESVSANANFRKTTFGSISYGNTAFSMGYYTNFFNKAADETLVNAVCFLPPSLKEKTYGPNTEGTRIAVEKILKKIKEKCTIIEIDLKKQIYRSNDLERIARENGVVLDEFIDITEGLSRPAYVNIIIEAIEQQLKFAPDYVIVPFGAGILCNEIIDYVNDKKLKTKVIPVSSGDPNTIAIMLYGPIWVDTESLLKKGSGWTRHEDIDKKGRKREPYLVHHIADGEILSAMEILKQNNISAEASGASGFALLPRLKNIDPEFDSENHSVLVINTGNGLLNFS
jgi:threonine dehydratase